MLLGFIIGGTIICGFLYYIVKGLQNKNQRIIKWLYKEAHLIPFPKKER